MMRRMTSAFVALVLCGLALAAQTPDYAAMGRQVVQHMSSGQFAAVEKQLNAKMAAALPAPTLQSVWIHVEKRFGLFKDITSATVRPVQGQQLVLVACRFANGPVTVQLAFDAQGKISGLYFR
ncbi:MAG: DUF3887 domain-containing protein [Terriglobales bacterium]